MSWIFACKLLMKKLIQCCRISILIWYCETRYHDILLSLMFSYAPNGDVSVQRTWKLNTVKLNYSTKLLHELHCCSCYSWSVYALEQHRLYHKAIKCFLISRSPHKMTWWATLHPRAFSFTHAVKQKLLHVVSKEIGIFKYRYRDWLIVASLPEHLRSSYWLRTWRHWCLGFLLKFKPRFREDVIFYRYKTFAEVQTGIAAASWKVFIHMWADD